MLTRIAFAGKRYWGYPKAWIESWRETLTITGKYIRAQEVCTVSREGDVVGFYALVRRPNGMSLDHLWVLPEAMNRGVGRSLFGHALRRARTLGFQTIEIESDPNAEGFYLRMGARRVSAKAAEIEGHRRELAILECDTALDVSPV